MIINRDMKLTTVAAITMMLGIPAAMSGKSAYISRVLEFCPAPGQFVNEVPWWETGWSVDDITAEAADNIVGTSADPAPGMISLGAFGGYVIFAFDHPVVNVAGEYDFKIYGNAVRSETAADGGSSEPGIVMVSVDSNGNGLADDEWFELAGSEYNAATTRRKCKITYYRPDENKVAEKEPGQPFILDRTYIRWTSDNPDAPEGYVARNSFHRHSYWPEWNDDDEMTFEGTLLANNSYSTGSDVVLRFLPWGYVDNLPDDEDAGFKIDWAVDADGNHVELTHVDFIKVYTAMNQLNGRLGESSTEIRGGEDLHPDAVSSGIEAIEAAAEAVTLLAVGNGNLSINATEDCVLNVVSMSGAMVHSTNIYQGQNDIDITAWPRGVYILSAGCSNIKIII